MAKAEIEQRLAEIRADHDAGFRLKRSQAEFLLSQLADAEQAKVEVLKVWYSVFCTLVDAHRDGKYSDGQLVGKMQQLREKLIQNLPEVEAALQRIALLERELPSMSQDSKPEPRTCNRHFDCDAAEAEVLARNPGKTKADIHLSFHCYDEDCEDCFGQ